MNRADLIPTKIFTLPLLLKKLAQWKIHNKKMAFTNGVFDILHQGHVFSLSQAAKEADYLIVGLNADASVKRLKGDNRPVNNQDSRALVLASLIMVDAVVLFKEDYSISKLPRFIRSRSKLTDFWPCYIPMCSNNSGSATRL